MLPILHREQPLRAVALALERLREVDLVELAAAAPPGPEWGQWAERHSISLWRMA